MKYDNKSELKTVNKYHFKIVIPLIIAILIGMLIDSSFAIDVALIYAVFGFLGTIMMARFVERRGDI